MNELSRRDLCGALVAFAAAGTLEAQVPATESESGSRLVHSQIFPFANLHPHDLANNVGVSRSVMQGTLATGEFVEVHETTLAPGQMPHPPHRHTHSELLLIREGTLEVMSDGQRGTVGPGDVIFTASAVLHGLKNIGEIPANYFVVAVGLQKVIV